MKKTQKKLLCLLLAALMIAGTLGPAYAEGDATTPGTESTTPGTENGDNTDTTPETEETTPDGDDSSPDDQTPAPVVQSIDINANYYTDADNTYSIVFTAMEEIPAFTQLTMKIKLAGATNIDKAFFDEAILVGGSDQVVRGNDFAIYPLTYTEAKSIPEKTTLCTLVVESTTAPTAENLSILDFSIIKENETEATPLSANITLAAGPIIPELNTEAQKVYDMLCALPNPATLSYYQEDGSFTNLTMLLEKTEAAKTAYNNLPSALRADLDTVMEYHNKTNYAVGNLSSMLQGMIDAKGLIEIAKATESITQENALSYQFLVTVFASKKNISLENIIPGSTARNEISQVISAMQTASETVAAAKAIVDAETDGGCKTKTYACQAQLSTIQSLSSHKYHSDYLVDLESQIAALKLAIETAYASDAIMKKALLDTLSDAEATITLIKDGVKELPTVSMTNLNRGTTYTVTFTRKSILPEVLSVSASFVVTDKNGTQIDTKEMVFPANSLVLQIDQIASLNTYTENEYYTFSFYYHINDGKFLVDTQEVKCTYIRTEQIGGLGNSIGSGLGGGKPSIPITTPTTPSTGGTIFPESNDEPEPEPEIEEPDPVVIFHDIEKYGWAAEAINTLYEEGIINGMEEGVFNPAGQVTREQFCKMVVALFDIPLGDSAAEFVDVKADAWYAPYITAAMQAGYVQGQSDEYFGIGESIMRQDMAVILHRALGDQNSKAILNFSDKESIAPYAEDAIAELVGLGIINGYEDGSLQPRGTATRAEAAKMIYGIYQYLND